VRFHKTDNVNYQLVYDSSTEQEFSDMYSMLDVANELEMKVLKLKRLLLLIDPMVSHFQCGSEEQLAQWQEFIRAYPEEGEQ
tara:strand:+ start:823 stop:1068 length:246 start_codon:yes stop_codon:yes gene_type:complete